MAVLVEAWRFAQEHGIELAVTSPSPAVTQVFDVAPSGQLLTLRTLRFTRNSRRLAERLAGMLVEPVGRFGSCADVGGRGVGAVVTAAALISGGCGRARTSRSSPSSLPKGGIRDPELLGAEREGRREHRSQLEVTFPTKYPIASVSVKPMTGWTITTEKTKLAKPVATDDGSVTEAVSKITWTATAGGLEPGQFDLFTISAGPLPTKPSKLEFKALQTYSDGDIVRWIEPSVKGARRSPSTRHRRSRSPRRRAATGIRFPGACPARSPSSASSSSTDAIADLRDRLARTRWPEAETVDDWSQGLPLAYAQDLCGYWADGYDFGAAEQRFNAFPQFRTDAAGRWRPSDGLGIHFIHARSPHADALPLVLTHGWPGSVVEFQKVIGPLSDPTAYGGDAADAFHVVCPSLPGYGFSDKPSSPGWNVERIARAWAELMARLGYDRYGAQGGDWGSFVTTSIGAAGPRARRGHPRATSRSCRSTRR